MPDLKKGIEKVKALLHRRYSPLNIIQISSKNLTNNYLFLSSLNKKINVAPVLKSNAYGHGLTLVAKVLEKQNPPFFCVDSLYEAYELLKSGIKTPILIMGYIDPKSLQTKKLPFSFAVYGYDLVGALNTYQPQAKIHIFVDTGMHREGVSIEDLEKFVNHIKTKTDLQVEGLMSHFGMSEFPDDELTKQQVDQFQKALKILKDEGFDPNWIHIANSSGLLNNRHFKGRLGNVARTGIALYGFDPDGNMNLKPVLQLKSHISQVKLLKKAERIGYDFTFTAKKSMKIAVLPIGYYDGVDRRLSNKGSITIDSVACPILGRVSMNITTIDVSNVPDARAGKEVVVYSNNARDLNSIENSAKLCNTIPHDILVHLASSTRRV